MTAWDQFIFQAAIFIYIGVSLCDNVVAFFNRRQIIHFIGDHAINNFAVWGFEETILVSTKYTASELIRPMFGPSGVSIGPDDRSESDVRLELRSRHVHGQTARAQRRNTAFVRNFGQRVVLIHKL